MAVHDDDNDKSLFLFFARYIYIKKFKFEFLNLLNLRIWKVNSTKKVTQNLIKNPPILN